MPGYCTKLRKQKQVHRLQDLASELLQQFLRGVSKHKPALKALGELDQMQVTALSKLLLGSTAAQVVQLSTLAVLVAKRGQQCAA